MIFSKLDNIKHKSLTLLFQHFVPTIPTGYKFSKHFIKYKGHNSILEKLLERIYFIEFRILHYTQEIEIFQYFKRRVSCLPCLVD